MDIASIKITNTIATNVTKNCHSKKVRYKFDCSILHRVLLAIILLLIITFFQSVFIYSRNTNLKFTKMKN